jgi:hypothetical protein
LVAEPVEQALDEAENWAGGAKVAPIGLSWLLEEPLSRMPLQRAVTSTSLIDVLDRVLDKGIVIDAWGRVSLVGIDLITVEARVFVASIATYLNYADVIAQSAPLSRPAIHPAR